MANKVVSGKFTDSGTGHSPYAGGESGGGKSNPLSDSRLMKKASGSYGGYERYSIGQRPNYKSPAPTVQDKGNIQDGQ